MSAKKEMRTLRRFIPSIGWLGLAVCLAGRADLKAEVPVAANSGVTPILLVPGFWYKYSKPVLGQKVFDSFTRWLVAAGFPAEHIYILDYDTIATLSNIDRKLNRQVETIFSRYPATTRFDVMAHSLGGFVSLFSMVSNGHAARFRKFISLAGIPQGWDGYGVCRIGLCGLVHPLVIPYHSNFVLHFLDQYAAQIRALDKCSLYSPNDGMVSPYNAGHFDDGTNVEIPGLTHMDMVFSKTSFDAVVNSCYGGKLLSAP